MSRFALTEKIQKGHYVLRVRDHSRSLQERKDGLGDFWQEVEVYDQSKKPPLMIAAWPGDEVIRALFKPTGRPIVSRAKLKAKDDDTSGFEALDRDAQRNLKDITKAWKSGGPCPLCERPYDGDLQGEEPCEFCDMPTKPPTQDPPVEPSEKT